MVLNKQKSQIAISEMLAKFTILFYIILQILPQGAKAMLCVRKIDPLSSRVAKKCNAADKCLLTDGQGC